MATSSIKPPSRTTGPPGARPAAPPQELAAVPRFVSIPTFPDPESAKKAKKAKRPSVLWPRIWQWIRNPSMLWVSVAGVAVALGGILMWGRSVRSTPTYALSQVTLAIRRHDGTKLAYYADGARLTQQVVDETLDWLVRERGVGALAGIDGVAEAHGRAAKLQAATASETDRLNRALSAALMARVADTADPGTRVMRQFSALPPLVTVIGSDHLDILAVGRPDVRLGTAEIPVTVQERELQIDIPLALVLRREGPRWRVVAVHGIARALRAIDKAQREQLTIANRGRERRLAETLVLGAPAVQQVAHGRSRTVFRLRVPVTNRSSDHVVGVLLGLRPRAADDDHAAALAVQHAIAPGATSTEVWQFDETAAAGTRVAAMLEHPERLVLSVRSIVVDSAGRADTLRLLRSYAEMRGETDVAAAPADSGEGN